MDTPRSGDPAAEQKTIRVRSDTHGKFIAKQRQVRARSADDLMQMLIDPTALIIPCNQAVRDRWEAHAATTGYELDHWVVLIIEAYLAYSASPGAIQLSMENARMVMTKQAAALTERPCSKCGGTEADHIAKSMNHRYTYTAGTRVLGEEPK